MKFDTHNTTPGIHHNANGTSLQGRITATYSELTSLFGEPTSGDGYKVDAEWYIQFEDGTFATIYNWKSGKNYCGAEGLEVKDITDWHVGGMSKASADRVQIALDLDREVREAEKPKDKIEEAFGSAIDLMDTVRRQHGKLYADAVEGALLVKKQKALVNMLLGALVDIEVMPKGAAEHLDQAFSAISAKLLAKLARHAEITCTQDAAKTLMEWADRIEEAEKQGADKLFKHLMKDKDE